MSGGDIMKYEKYEKEFKRLREMQKQAFFERFNDQRRLYPVHLKTLTEIKYLGYL